MPRGKGLQTEERQIKRREKETHGCGRTAYVLLEFMQKSNNTKRNEATQESSSHAAQPPLSASLTTSSRDTQRNGLLLRGRKQA